MDYAVLFIYFDFDCGVTGVCVFLKKKNTDTLLFLSLLPFFFFLFFFFAVFTQRGTKGMSGWVKILDYLMIEGGFLSIHLFLAFPAPFFTREAYINFSVTLEKKGKVELKSENEQEQ